MSSIASSDKITNAASHSIRSYPGFLWWGLGQATNGGLGFYLWMFVLTAISLVGANASAHQVAGGMIVTLVWTRLNLFSSVRDSSQTTGVQGILHPPVTGWVIIPTCPGNHTEPCPPSETQTADFQANSHWHSCCCSSDQENACQ